MKGVDMMMGNELTGGKEQTEGAKGKLRQEV